MQLPYTYSNKISRQWPSCGQGQWTFPRLDMLGLDSLRGAFSLGLICSPEGLPRIWKAARRTWNVGQGGGAQKAGIVF